MLQRLRANGIHSRERSGYRQPLGRSTALPLYEYHCVKDGTFEQVRKFSDPPLEKCPKCGGPIEKLLSAPAIQFKGTGWYITDYARKGGGKDSGKDSGKESSSSDKSSSSSDKSGGTTSTSSSDSRPTGSSSGGGDKK
jgi:putative FmdB family regulatory protein